jgi:hypothetical protein
MVAEKDQVMSSHNLQCPQRRYAASVSWKILESPGLGGPDVAGNPSGLLPFPCCQMTIPIDLTTSVPF